MQAARDGEATRYALRGDAALRVAIMTVASIALSSAITFCATLLFFGADFDTTIALSDVWRFSVGAGIGVPALVCPVVAWRMTMVMRALAEARAALELLSRTDQLTGLFNRRGLDLEAESLVAAARRQGRPLAVMICDIDFFKTINDQFGHEAGDEVLRHVARVLRAAVGRRPAVLARQGGEEFAIILLGVSQREAEIFAEKLRDACATTLVPLMAKTTSVTLSIGLICDECNTLDFATLMRRADAALYRAKRNGRNQVFAAIASNSPLFGTDSRDDKAAVLSGL